MSDGQPSHRRDKDGHWFILCLEFHHVHHRIMDPSSDKPTGQGWGRGARIETRIFRRRLSSNLSLETKVNWCFKMFHTLDNTLTTYMLSAYPCQQTSEDRLNDFEAKVEVLVAWLT